MITLILVVLVLLAFHKVKDKLYCKIGWHDWSMYAGYDQIRVHGDAHCKRPGCEMTGKKWLGRNK